MKLKNTFLFGLFIVLKNILQTQSNPCTFMKKPFIRITSEISLTQLEQPSQKAASTSTDRTLPLAPCSVLRCRSLDSLKYIGQLDDWERINLCRAAQRFLMYDVGVWLELQSISTGKANMYSFQVDLNGSEDRVVAYKCETRPPIYLQGDITPKAMKLETILIWYESDTLTQGTKLPLHWFPASLSQSNQVPEGTARQTFRQYL